MKPSLTKHVRRFVTTWSRSTLTKALVFVVVLQGIFGAWTPSASALTWGNTAANTSSAWTSIVYGNGILCAVASIGTEKSMWSSDGGDTWSYSTNAPDQQWASLAYGEGLFVAVATSGAQRVMTSPDCNNWTSRNAASNAQAWRSVTYGGGQFVAVGCGNADSFGACGVNKAAMTSPDGTVWTLQTTGVPDTNWTSVAYGGGSYVAVGALFSGTQRVMRSTDGVTWVGENVTGSGTWQSVTYGNGRFVAVSSANSPRVMYSDNGGDTWTSVTPPVTGSWRSVRYAAGLFVAVSDGNEVMSSADGANWTADTDMPDQFWRDVAWAEGFWVAVACSSTSGTATCNATLVDRVARTTWVPTPLAGSINPNTVTAGSGDFTITVNGSNFTTLSVVRVNGSNRVTDTTNWESGVLTATVLASDIATAGTRNISVLQQGKASGNVTLTINNPTPAISGISPSSVPFGDDDFTLTVNGSGFVTSSVVRVGGANRTTTYVSPTQLTATVLEADIASPGTKDIEVFNPTPGGGLSNKETLNISGDAAITVSHFSASPLTTDSVTLSVDAQYNGGIDAIELFLDGDLVHTCTFVGEPTEAECDFNVGKLTYGAHLTETVIHGADSNDFEAEETFYVSEHTTFNSVTLSRLKAGEEATATTRYTLAGTLSGVVTVTFPAGFTVTGAPTAEESSPCLSDFGFNAPSRTVFATKTNCTGPLILSGATVVNPAAPGVYKIGWVNDDPGEAAVVIMVEDTISVTASVDPSMQFDVWADTDDCVYGASSGLSEVPLGVLSSGSVTTSDPHGGAGAIRHICLQLATNAAGGASVTVQSLNAGLASASVPSDVIPANVGAVTAGNAAYGICVNRVEIEDTTPTGTLRASGGSQDEWGGSAMIATGSTTSDTSTTCDEANHGTTTALSGGIQNLLNTGDDGVAGAVATILVKAAVSGTSPAHTDYFDTLTFVATGTF